MHPSVTGRRGWKGNALLLLLLANLLFLLYYLAVDYRLALNSDSAVMNLLAQEIHETGQFIPASWNYANGDLWVWFTQALIVPLLAVWPNTYALHAAASVITAALVLLSAWCVTGMLGQSLRARLLVLALLAGGISPNMAENLYGQAAYGVLFYMGCLLAYSGWRWLHAQGRAAWAWGLAFALLALLVSWSNPQRALVFYALPLAAALLALQLAPAGAGAPRRGRGAALLALLVAATFAGVLLHRHYAALVGHSLPKPLQWLDVAAMAQHALGTLQGLLSLLGGLPPAGQPMLGPRGAYQALRLVAALVLLGLLPWTVRYVLRTPQQRGRLFFTIFALTALAGKLFLALTTTLPDMAAPEATVRYLAPSLLSLLIVLAGIAVDDFRWRRYWHGAAALILLLTAASAPASYAVARSPGYFKSGSINQYDHAWRLGQYLEQQGLHYGYASFWHAGHTTLASRLRVKVRAVGMDDGLPVPLRHLSSDRWYQAQAWQGETFLLLQSEEAQAIDAARLRRYLGEPSRTLNWEGWRIVVYPYNIAARLPFWDYAQATPLRLPVDAGSAHAVGRLADGGDALQAERGVAGALLFGPYRAIEPGYYEASFLLDAEGQAGAAGFGTVDVVSHGGAQPHASRIIGQAGAQRLSVRLRLDKRIDGAEFRVFSNGAGRLTVRGVELIALDPRLARQPALQERP